MRRGEAGFTVIEVLIVMSIAGLLLLGAFAAMNSSIESARFNDTMTTTQSFLQKQYLEVATGNNVRDNTLACSKNPLTGAPVVTTVPADTTITPGGSNCILLGRIVTIQEGQQRIVSRYIVGFEPSTIMSYATDTAAVLDYHPTVVYAAADPAQKTLAILYLPWSARISKVRNDAATEVRHFAIMRSPISERILIYSNQFGNLDAATLNTSTLNKKVDVCIDSEAGIFGRTGHLMVGAGQGQDLFTIERVGTAAC
jgi:prepilin-type N-terminal cleavage/methylation domain-containing protein